MTASLCGRRVHKACRCVRPAGHDGRCDYVFPDGPPGAVDDGEAAIARERAAHQADEANR